MKYDEVPYTRPLPIRVRGLGGLGLGEFCFGGFGSCAGIEACAIGCHSPGFAPNAYCKWICQDAVIPFGMHYKDS